MSSMKRNSNLILQWAMFAALIYLIDPKYGWYLPAFGVIPLLIFPRKKLLVMSAVTLIAWVFGEHLQWRFMQKPLNFYGVNVMSGDYLFRLLCCLATAGCAFLFVYIIKKNKFLKQKIVIFFSIYYLILIAISGFVGAAQVSNYIKALSYGVVFIFTQLTWGLILLAEEQHSVKDSAIKAVFRIQPFWGTGELIQSPAGESMLNRLEASEESERNRLSKRVAA